MPDFEPINKTARRRQTVFNHLSFGGRHWAGAGFGDIAFRGQGDASWVLVPSAFRDGEEVGYGDKSITAPASTNRDQAEAEYSAVINFVNIADRSGLRLPGDIHELRSVINKSGREEDLFWTQEWPSDSFLELVAIAQHHQVKTRLLDFTLDPWVALYFAAEKALELSCSENPPSHFTVWAIDLRFVRKLWERTPGFPERIREIIVPRAENKFLHAQQGLFLVDAAATRADISGTSWSALPLDEVITERANYWAERSGAWPGVDLDNDFFCLISG